MSPRRYRMGARGDAVAATRSRILRAAMDLHVSGGVLATGWDDIAREAEVATATVYRHFPSLAELVPACAREVFDIIRPPTVEEASVQFATMSGAADRFEHLVRESCHCYRRGEGWLHAAHRERDFVPELDAALRLIEDTLHVLVEAAAGDRLPEPAHAALFALNDFPFWWSLAHAGLSYETAQETLIALVRAETARLGLDTTATPGSRK